MLESIHIDVFWRDLAQFCACMIHVLTYSLFFSPMISLLSVTHESCLCIQTAHPPVASQFKKIKKNLICFQCDWNWHAAPCGYMLCFSLSLWIIQQNIETYLSVTPCKLHNCKTELLNKNRSAAALHERATFIFTFIFFFLTGLEIQMVKKHKRVTSREET